MKHIGIVFTSLIGLFNFYTLHGVYLFSIKFFSFLNKMMIILIRIEWIKQQNSGIDKTITVWKKWIIIITSMLVF